MRRQIPNPDDEYTPEQRKTIDAALAKGLADIKAGRVSKAFSDHREFIADLHKAARKLKNRGTFSLRREGWEL